ncbi:MAG: DUF84 family protein [Nanoarchaeota archaeon]|nr:DUF84 family protein [Nanoarchaeota archaeon]
MIISIGSLNPTKREAVELIVKKVFPEYTIQLKDVDPKISKQPHSEAEAIAGSTNRAFGAFSGKRGEEISFGLESYTIKDGYDGNTYNICMCSLFDGNAFYRAASSQFYIPSDISDLLGANTDLSEAVKQAGVSDFKGKIGEDMGLIGILTREVFGEEYTTTRAEYMSEAVRNSVMQYVLSKTNSLFNKHKDQQGKNLKEREEKKN